MISFFVAGVPQPQGSARAFVVQGRAVVTSANKNLRPWRDSVLAAARAEMAVADERITKPTPVAVRITFYLQRPASHTKKQQERRAVTVRPDIDKLARAVLDALTVARVFDDDAQVYDLHVLKQYANDDEPIGAWIDVRSH